jgi:very-short-patch-repair endonuclease
MLRHPLHSNPVPAGPDPRKWDQKGGRTLVGMAIAAGARDGVVGRQELLAMGIGPGAIAHHLQARHLVPLYQGTYAIGHGRLSERGRLRAALVAVKGSALSHRTAALVHGILDEREWEPTVGVIHLTRTSGGAAGLRRALTSDQPSLQVHRARKLAPEDVVTRHELTVTSIDRTLIDLAGQLAPFRVEGVVLRAHRLRLLNVTRLRERLQGMGRGRTGIRALREAVEGLTPAKSRTLSDPEAWILDLVQQHNLPEPEVNVWVEGLLVDFCWRKQRLVVEFDGHFFHSGRMALQRDKKRDRKLQLAGFTVLRYTYDDLIAAPQRIATEIAAALNAHSSP